MSPISKQEFPVVWKLFVYSLGIATSYVVARTVGDSLFLSQIGTERLALVYVMAGCATAIFAAGWYLVTQRYSVASTIQFSGIAFASVTLLAWWLLPAFGSSFWLLAAVYLLAEVKGCINAINIISALNTKLGRDASKSAWATVGIAAPIAAVVMGSVLAVESAALGLRDWLLVIVALDLLAGFTGFLLRQTPNVKQIMQAVQIPGNDQNEAVKPRSYIASNQFQKWIGILVSAKVIALTIVSFEWKTAVNSYYAGNSEQLVRYFGVYYGCIGLATIGLQILLTSRLLIARMFNVALLFIPLALLFLVALFSFSLSMTWILVLVTAAKSMDAWRRSVHDTTMNLLYTCIERSKRRFAILLNAGLVKPMSEVAAACLIFFGTLQIYRPALLVVLGVWLVAARSLVALVSETSRSTTASNDATSKKPAVAELSSGIVGRKPGVNQS